MPPPKGRKNPWNLTGRGFLSKGAPFMLLMIGGSVGLAKLIEGKYEAMDHVTGQRAVSKEEEDLLNESFEFDLEKQLKLMEKEIDTENWENVRVARPDDLMTQEELDKRRRLKQQQDESVARSRKKQ